MAREIFCRNTRELAYQCIINAVIHREYDIKRDITVYDLMPNSLVAKFYNAMELFELCWNRINWSDRESILPFIPILENTYHIPYRSFTAVHKKLDAYLEKDGFCMQEGKLVRLPKRF